MATLTRVETAKKPKPGASAKAKTETAAKVKSEVAKKAVKPTAATGQKKGQTDAAKMAMTLAQKRAKALQIAVGDLALADLVRAVQRAEGNFDCFGTAVEGCDQDGCCWRAVCLVSMS